MKKPLSPIEAVMHHHPYPWYAQLARDEPFSFVDDIGMWVAASAAAVESVLTSPVVGVRPANQPVPELLRSSPVGDVFRQLIRMTDGPVHQHRKRAAQAVLSQFTPDVVETTAHDQATRLLQHPQYLDDPTGFAFALPARVIGRWLGVEDESLDVLPGLVEDFVRAIGPDTTVGQVERGNAAVARLRQEIAHGGRVAPDIVDPEVAVANSIGFLFQAHDATAGLIGNTLLALAADENMARACRDDHSRLEALTDHVARYDPSIHNTRRFVVKDGQIAGQDVHEGQAILVLLAVACPDPAMRDSSSGNLAFGAGPHACPGKRIAQKIATVGVQQLLATGCDAAALATSFTYMPSANARVPVFSPRLEAQS